MVATAQRFHELNPEVSIEWSVRSLQAFADEPLARLVESFDLLVIDHPSICAAAAARFGVSPRPVGPLGRAVSRQLFPCWETVGAGD